MLAIKIDIKQNLSCSVCEFSPIMAKDIAYFKKYLIICMFTSIQLLVTVLQMEFLGIDLRANPGMILNKNDQLVVQK